MRAERRGLILVSVTRPIRDVLMRFAQIHGSSGSGWCRLHRIAHGQAAGRSRQRLYSVESGGLARQTVVRVLVQRLGSRGTGAFTRRRGTSQASVHLAHAAREMPLGSLPTRHGPKSSLAGFPAMPN